MRFMEFLLEVDVFPGVEAKQVDLSHWDPEITDAYFMTLHDGSHMVRYDHGNARNLDIRQYPEESYEQFRVRVKKTILRNKEQDDRRKAIRR